MSAGCFDNSSCLYNTTNINMSFNEHHSPINHLQNKQGIISVLNPDHINPSNNNILLPFRTNSTPSIRRTLSADMSSQIWLQTNGLRSPTSPVKRAKSSLHLQALGQDQGNHDINHHDNDKGPAFEEIWSSIQANNKSWGCLLSPASPNKDGSGSDSGQVAPPYVHPLVKRTGSSLSEKSLDICTESLGSETGSDGFSFPPSDSDHEPEEEEDDDEGEEEEVELKGCNAQQVGVGMNKFMYNNINRGPTRKRTMMVPPTRPSSFPPPLPSLSHRDDGSNLHIRSHRKDGRLVVEAVSVPSQNCFRAKRQDGRLLLTFSGTTADDDDDDDQVADDNYAQKAQVERHQETIEVIKEDDDKGARAEAGVMKRSASSSISCTAMTMMSKFMFMDMANKSTTWPRNYNTAVIKTLNNNNEEEEEDDDDDKEVMPSAMTKQSLPPRPANSSAALNNAYEYYWRRGSSTAVGMLKPLITNTSMSSKKGVGKHSKRNNNRVVYAPGPHNLKKGSQQQEQVVVPLMQLRDCKEAKRPASLLLWEPHCIATS